MPTFNWIQETAWDRYYETGTDIKDAISTPATYPCRQCSKVFKTIELRNRHELEHPIKNPQLFIRENELIGNEYTITEKLSSNEIKVNHVDQIMINGGESSLKNLCDILSTEKNDYYEVIYSNKDTPKKKVNIHICIADESEIKKIDDYFGEFFSCDDFTAKEIEKFRVATQDFNSCTGYANGIVAYLHGIMAKDQRTEKIKFEDFPVKFNQAIDSLKKYNTNLSIALRRIMSFNNNFFEETKTGILVLDKATSFFNNKFINSNDFHPSGYIKLPIDLSTAFIVDDLIGHFYKTDLIDIESKISSFNSKYLSQQDRSKIEFIAFKKASIEENSSKIDIYRKKLKNDSIFSSYL